jgi:hypothetical protein
MSGVCGSPDGPRQKNRSTNGHSVKLILQITAAVLVAALVFWWISDPDGFRHKLWGYSAEEQKAAWQEVDNTVARSKREMDERLLEARVHLIEMRHGEASASTYRLCHTNPPQTKQHQEECKRLDAQVARDEARDNKNPW